MKGKIIKELAILVSLFLLVWLAFIFIPLKPAPPEAALSVEKEQEIGDVLIDAFLQDQKVITDSVVMGAIDQIHDRLLAVLDTTEYDYHIYVIRNDNINAFASLGGNMVVFSGLLKYADNPEEVAAVLAHEMGHVEKRHVVNKVVKELGISLVLSVISGGDPGFINQILQQSVSTVFDRSQESEADDFGLALLEKAEIHPNAMAAIFRKIKDEYGSSTFENLEFLSTHPNTNKRIKKSLNYKTKKGFASNPFDTIDWKAVQIAL